MENCKEEFIRIFSKEITRDGSDDLLQWLLGTDFFTAPASTKYHLAKEGGLCQHSLNVFHRLKHFLAAEYGDECPYSGETIAIVSLCHDLCKIGTYHISRKNQKTYDPEKVASAPRNQVKHDAGGDFIWESVPFYEYKDPFVYGHGEKSVYLMMPFIDLYSEEAQAIRWHMGPYMDGETRDACEAFKANPLAFFLHIADSAASFIDEKNM